MLHQLTQYRTLSKVAFTRLHTYQRGPLQLMAQGTGVTGSTRFGVPYRSAVDA
jgi:hypothetical protein